MLKNSEAGAPSIVNVDGVTKRFVLNRHKSLKERIVNAASARQHREEFLALSGVDLTIPAGSTVGLVGHNGSGKSTLLKIIGGIIEPSTGKVERRGRMAALLELGAGFHPDLTGRDNVYLNASILGLSEKEIDSYYDDIVEFSGIGDFINSQVKFYSSGMYVRLAFAVAVHVNPDLLLVDEVLAVGDEPFQEKCMAKIAEFQRQGRTIVLVSHSADQIKRLCDRVVVLDHGHVVFDGDPLDGIDVLQAGYRAVARTSAADDDPPIGNIAVTVVDDDGAEVFRVDTETPITVLADYRVLRTVDRVDAAVTLRNQDGVGVIVIDPKNLGHSLPTAPGVHRFSVRICSLPLKDGPYRVGVEFAEIGRPALTADRTLSVASEKRNLGLLSLDISSEMIRLGD